jgi:hypothetical protein
MRGGVDDDAAETAVYAAGSRALQLPAEGARRTWKPGAASRRSSVSDRLLWGARDSTIAGGHRQAADATIGTVAKA